MPDMFEFKKVDMPKNIFGRVNMGKMPFEVLINKRTSSKVRQLISVVHEQLHPWFLFNKVPISHQNLHMLSVYFVTVVLPNIIRLSKKHFFK